jgi:hypothetical protein
MAVDFSSEQGSVESIEISWRRSHDRLKPPGLLWWSGGVLPLRVRNRRLRVQHRLGIALWDLTGDRRDCRSVVVQLPQAAFPDAAHDLHNDADDRYPDENLKQ